MRAKWVQPGVHVATTINVPHKETAQIATLIIMVGTLRSAIGDGISGAIYTGIFHQQLATELGDKSRPPLADHPL